MFRIIEVIKLCTVVYKCMYGFETVFNSSSNRCLYHCTVYIYINGGGKGGVILEYLMRFELICCPMRGVIELGSVKPPCMPHLSPDGGRWGNTLIGA